MEKKIPGLADFGLYTKQCIRDNTLDDAHRDTMSA